MRLVRRLLFVYALGEPLLGSAAGLLVRASAPSGGAPTAGRNAAWIAHHWVGSPHSRAEVAMLCALLREHRIGTVYVHVGPADAAGRIAAGRAPYAAQFASTLHGVCPGIRALAWIGQLLVCWDGLLDLRRGSVRNGLVGTAARFVASGFDGVQYNLEPVRDSDPGREDLLRRARRALPHAWIAVATPPVRPPGGFGALPRLRLPLSPWSVGYYARVAALANELDPMLYDTALRTPADYVRFVAGQACPLGSALPGATIRLGLPTFGGRSAVFDARAENLAAACAGLAAAFGAGHWPAPLVGFALYPLWLMTAPQWAALTRCGP